MEWTVVTVIIALGGFLALLVKPIIGLNTAITKLSTSVDRLEEKLEDNSTRNSKAHDVLFETQRRHDDRLDDHDRRITAVEHR